MHAHTYVCVCFLVKWSLNSGFALAKAGSLPLDYTSSPFFSDYFGDWVSHLFAQGDLEPQSS
jgi:hypothetical protein